MSKGIVIAGFAGIGKTTLAKKYKNVIDIESSPYKYDYGNKEIVDVERIKGDKSRSVNKDFPLNYINAIKKAIEEYDVVCVWIHPEEALPNYDKYGIEYYLCFPYKNALSEYGERFLNRGNTREYIDRVIGDYDKRYEQFMSNPHKKLLLKKGETLEDVLKREKIIN